MLTTLTDAELAGSLTLDGQKKAGLLLPPGNYTINDKPVVLQAGQLTTLPVVKTKRFAVNLDADDPAFPDSAAFSCVTMRYTPPGGEPVFDGQRLAVRAGADAERLREGRRARGLLGNGLAFGIRVTPQVQNGVETDTLNRLESQDVQVGSSTVKGRAKIEVKSTNGQYGALSCNSDNDFPTSTGIDLPDGTYRMTLDRHDRFRPDHVGRGSLVPLTRATRPGSCGLTLRRSCRRVDGRTSATRSRRAARRPSARCRRRLRD